MFTRDNYSRGLLVDDQLLAGITEDPKLPGNYIAFVLSQETGEYLGYESFPALEPALDRINGIPRKWSYEKTGGCGDGACTDGNCAKSATCKLKARGGNCKTC